MGDASDNTAGKGGAPAPPELEWPTGEDAYADWLAAFQNNGEQSRGDGAAADATHEAVYGPGGGADDSLDVDAASLYTTKSFKRSTGDAGVPIASSLVSAGIDAGQSLVAFSEVQYNQYTSQTKDARGKALDEIRSDDPGGQLNERDRKQLGEWLNKNFSRLDGVRTADEIKDFDEINFKDGVIGFDEMRAVYANQKWPDGTSLSREDAVMLRQAALHYDFYSVEKGGINQLMIDDMRAGAKFSRPDDYTIVSTRPDGTKTQHFRNGGSQSTHPDGTEVIRTTSMMGSPNTTITMRPDGTGTFKSEFAGTGVTEETQMSREADGTWAIQTADGQPWARFKFDKANQSFLMTTADGDRIEMSKDAQGVRTLSMRSTDDQGKIHEATINLNTGVTDMTDDDGNRIKVQQASDGVIGMTTQDNSKQYKIPDGSFVRRPTGGGTILDAGGEDGVRVEVAANGQVKVINTDGTEIPVRPGSNGNLTASAGDVKVVVKPNGMINVVMGKGPDRVNVVVAGNNVYTRSGNDPPQMYTLF